MTQKRVNDSEDINFSELRNEYIESKTGLVIRYELVGIIFAIVIQTLGAVWWGGSFSSVVTTKIDYLQASIISMKAEMRDGMSDRYTAKDAAKDFSSMQQRIDRNEIRISRLEQKP